MLELGGAIFWEEGWNDLSNPKVTFTLNWNGCLQYLVINKFLSYFCSKRSWIILLAPSQGVFVQTTNFSWTHQLHSFFSYVLTTLSLFHVPKSFIIVQKDKDKNKNCTISLVSALYDTHQLVPRCILIKDASESLLIQIADLNVCIFRSLYSHIFVFSD